MNKYLDRNDYITIWLQNKKEEKKKSIIKKNREVMENENSK